MKIYQNQERDHQSYSGGVVRIVEDPVLGYKISLSHCYASDAGCSMGKVSQVYVSGAYERFPELVLEGHVAPEDLATFYWEKLLAMASPNDLRLIIKEVRAAAVQHGCELVQSKVRAALGL